MNKYEQKSLSQGLLREVFSKPDPETVSQSLRFMQHLGSFCHICTLFLLLQKHTVYRSCGLHGLCRLDTGSYCKGENLI